MGIEPTHGTRDATNVRFAPKADMEDFTAGQAPLQPNLRKAISNSRQSATAGTGPISGAESYARG